VVCDCPVIARDPFIHKEANTSLLVVMVGDLKMLRDGIVGCVNKRVLLWLLDSQHIVACNFPVSKQCSHNSITGFHYIVLQY
jgi:hypothetical protein